MPISLLTSLQTAMLLLEKSVHEKQDTIVGLRRQLEEVKTANLKMTSQLKVRGCGFGKPLAPLIYPGIHFTFSFSLSFFPHLCGRLVRRPIRKIP